MASCAAQSQLMASIQITLHIDATMDGCLKMQEYLTALQSSFQVLFTLTATTDRGKSDSRSKLGELGNLGTREIDVRSDMSSGDFNTDGNSRSAQVDWHDSE